MLRKCCFFLCFSSCFNILSGNDLDQIESTDNHWMPLHCALYLDAPVAAEIFISKGEIDINEKNCSGKTPLHIAAQEGFTNITDMLLEKSAKIEKDNDGDTPLHLASLYGQTSSACRLIKSMSKKDIEEKNIHGMTALDYAPNENFKKFLINSINRK